jgi:hypothetical protein
MNYTAHSKDKNRNKSFHPLTAENLGRTERAEEAAKELEEQLRTRREVLRREREKDRAMQVLENSGDADLERAVKIRRVEHIFEDEVVLSAPDTLTRNSDIAPKEKVPVKTGTVTAADAEEYRKKLDDKMKARKDPMERILQHRNQEVAAVARAIERESEIASMVTSRKPSLPDDSLRDRLKNLLNQKKGS